MDSSIDWDLVTVVHKVILCTLRAVGICFLIVSWLLAETMGKLIPFDAIGEASPESTDDVGGLFYPVVHLQLIVQQVVQRAYRWCTPSCTPSSDPSCTPCIGLVPAADAAALSAALPAVVPTALSAALSDSAVAGVVFWAALAALLRSCRSLRAVQRAPSSCA